MSLTQITYLFLLLSYATYCALLLQIIPQSVRWYIFGVHLLLIVLTASVAIFAASRGFRVCLFALVGILPLVYLQFLS